ncbi:MAG: putative transporter permease protein [Microbacterium sp.]|jgi:multiple sugar transport system permease protein|uniref:carbohydrate ABC transporter permease n=1 Tax=Microbacterium sp. TaxID=51671 RepID=UPI002634CD4E|nr:sugar ABC transporter permease [Microbacterium sp.]MDF2563482.1 putative transporter permease protein [Microbacterium sp.]
MTSTIPTTAGAPPTAQILHPQSDPPARWRFTTQRRETWGYLAFLLPAFAYILLFFGYPLVKNVWMGFVDFRTATFVTGEAPWVGFDNYAEVLATVVVPIATVNTLIITTATVAIQLVLGLAIASFLNGKFAGARFYASSMLLPWLLPLVTTAAVWRWLLRDDGPLIVALAPLGVAGSPLANPDLALAAVVGVNIWLGIPFFVIILGAALQSVPADQLEAAQLDGAGRFGRFWHITLPAIRPQVTVAATLSIIYTLKVLELPLILTGGGPANATQTLGTVAYNLSFKQFEFGQGAAVGNILMVITLLFAVAYVYLGARKEDH